MKRYRATTPDELADIPVHDAWVDQDRVQHEPGQALVVVPFAQQALGWDGESLPADMPQWTFIRESRWYKEYRVPLMSSFLTIRNAVALEAPEGWADMGMLTGMEFDEEARQVVVESNEDLRVTVTSLDVEAHMTQDIGLILRRRVHKLFGSESDTVWEDAPS